MARAKKTRRSPPASRPAAAPRRYLWAAPLLIVLAGAITYANSFTGPFILDDVSIRLNSTIRDLSSWRVLVPPADSPLAGRPLANLSFAVSYALAGMEVWAYHAVNLALHLACGVLVFGLVKRQLSDGMACAVALFWTVHPLNSEVVNYLTQRTESLMAVCFLLTLYAASARGASRARAQVVAVAACAAGMACKETMAVAPLAVLLYDSAYEFGSVGAALRTRWRFYAALASTWLVVGVLTATSGQSLNAGFAFARPDTWIYLLNQSVMITEYLRLAVWPDSLVLYYGWVPPVTLPDVWPYLAFVGAILAVTLVALVRRPRIGALGAWVFLTLGPTSSLIPIVTEVGAERRMYLPLVGLVTLAVVGGAWLWSRAGAWRARAPWAPAAVVALVAVAFSVTTWRRNREYASALTMAETILARWPTPQASHFLGASLAEAGRYAEALPHLQTAATGFAMARYNLADALLKLGRGAEAVPHIEAFVPVAPPPAIRRAEILLAQAYMAAGEKAKAIEQLRKVLARTPDDVTAHGLIADLLAEGQRFDDAIPHYQAFLAKSPGNGPAETGLAVALVATGRGAEAVAAFQRAADAEPGNSRYRQNLARVLADHGDAANALKHAQEAVTLDARDPASFEVLGRVLLRLGRTADARLSFQRALQIDPAYAPAIDALRAMGR